MKATHSKSALGSFLSGCFFFHHMLSHSSAKELVSPEVGLGLEKLKSPVIGSTVCASDLYSSSPLLQRAADDVGVMSCALRYAL